MPQPNDTVCQIKSKLLQFSDLVRTISLRHLLLSELQVTVPLEFFGNPLYFAAPKAWVHAEREPQC